MTFVVPELAEAEDWSSSDIQYTPMPMDELDAMIAVPVGIALKEEQEPEALQAEADVRPGISFQFGLGSKNYELVEFVF